MLLTVGLEQFGLVRSLLSQDAKLVEAVDDVQSNHAFHLRLLTHFLGRAYTYTLGGLFRLG